MDAETRDHQPPAAPLGTEPTVVTRLVPLDRPADELWSMVGDGERWADWMVDDARVVVEAGEEGVVRDDGIERHVAIRHVEAGRVVRFDWWPTGQPGDASTVELVVQPGHHTDDGSEEGGGAGSALRIMETIPARPIPGGVLRGRSDGTGSATTVGLVHAATCAASAAWAVRAVGLWVWSRSPVRAIA